MILMQHVYKALSIVLISLFSLLSLFLPSSTFPTIHITAATQSPSLTSVVNTPTSTMTPAPEVVGDNVSPWLNPVVLAAIISLAGVLFSAIVTFMGVNKNTKILGQQLLNQNEQFKQQYEIQISELAQKRIQFEKELSLEWKKYSSTNPVKAKDVALEQLSALIDVYRPITNEAYGTPYIVGPAVNTIEDFYGRNKEVDEFFQRLKSPQYLSSSVLGIRRAGKTSFLLHVANPIVQAQWLGETAGRCLIVYIDLQSGVKTPSVFYRRLIEGTNDVLSARNNLGRVASLPKDDLVLDDLVDFLERIMTANLGVIYLLDEFETLASNSMFGADFFEGLRSLVVGRDVAWVVSSFHDLYQLGNKAGLSSGSEFFNIFYPEPIYIGAIDKDDAHNLVSVPANKVEIDFSKQQIEILLDLAGYMPYSIQMASSLLFGEYKNSVNELSLERIRDRFSRAMSRNYLSLWGKLSEPQKQILQFLADPQWKLSPQVRRNQQETLQWLSSYGLLKTINGSHKVSSGAFADWIIQHGKNQMT